jgi:DNA recombination protein RmuC
MEYIIGFIIGLIVGIVIVLAINSIRQRHREQDINNMKDAFSALSFEALTKSSDELIKRAEEVLSKKTSESEKELTEKKKSIDEHLKGVEDNLQKVERVVTAFEKDRAEKFGEIDKQLKNVVEQTGKLQDTTGKLQIALSSSKMRGQWGERMAEDVLRVAGFIEGINYLKQTTQETVSTRPDYTFFLPRDLKVNMDVKFPLDNYIAHYNATADVDKEKCKTQFLRDVKQRIKEVTGRDYINPEENTVDYVLVFIPNEQVYSFIQENDRSIVDEALKNKVVLCSPITLYAILAIIRQAVENFNIEKTADQILSLLGAFRKQWKAFGTSLEKMGKKIEEAHDEYNRLNTTRRRQLDRPLEKIDAIRTERGITEASLPEAELLSIESPEENDS